ncbi:MAG: pyridoxal-phosphate dependent enzyme, partial [Rickettsiales bacterium]|nr:pyridoxal-phosphate dependent enzyme [Rickettsiales bacterium]
EVKENGYCFIHPYDDVNTIEGQATLMEEVKAQLAEKGEKCDLVFSPVGGGGLISGIINVVEKYNMNTKVVGCQTELCHPLTKNFEKNENLESQIDKTKEVITDGSLVKKLGSLTWNIINNAYKNGEFALEVLENDKVLYCMGMAKIEHNIDVEGAGGLSFAGFLQYVKTHDVKNKNVVLVNSGGNVLPEMQQKAIAFYKKNRSVLV